MSIFQYSPDGSRVAATSADGRLSIWNKNSGKPTFLESLMKIVLCKNVCFCLCCSKFYVKESFCFTYFNAINERKYTNQRTKNCRFVYTQNSLGFSRNTSIELHLSAVFIICFFFTLTRLRIAKMKI